MEIETVGDLPNHIADWLGIYGCCKQETEDGNKPELCQFNKEKPVCCRVAFCSEIEERIRQAVKNEEKLFPEIISKLEIIIPTDDENYKMANEYADRMARDYGHCRNSAYCGYRNCWKKITGYKIKNNNE